MQEALREAMTTLPLNHTATLRLSFNFARILSYTEQYEAAARQWKWLISRGELLGGEWGDPAELRLSAARCLRQVQRYPEAITLAREAYLLRRDELTDDHEATMDALDTFIDCNEPIGGECVPPAEMLPLLQLHLAYLRRTAGNGSEDEGFALWRTLTALSNCQKQLGDLAAGEVTTRELVRVTKRYFGLHHLKYLEVGW